MWVAQQTAPQWVAYTFNEAKWIRYFDLQATDNDPYRTASNFTVSVDGVIIKTFTNIGANVKTPLSLDAPILGNEVKITVTNNNTTWGSLHVSFYGCKVWGYDTQ